MITFRRNVNPSPVVPIEKPPVHFEDSVEKATALCVQNVGTVSVSPKDSFAEREACSRVYAAADLLLEACEKMLEQFGQEKYPPESDKYDAIFTARVALAEAKPCKK